MESENNMKELFGEVIYAYTREQAIADGVRAWG
jgi:type I site-specific restriction endonuclease